MARTVIAISQFVAGSAVGLADPAGTAVDPANGHQVTPPRQFRKLLLRVAYTFAGAKTLTLKAGATPPAESAGQGDLVVTLNNQTSWIGPLESARFEQKDGSLWLDVQAAATGTITAFALPDRY